jgi:hypothetical protein
MMGIPTYGARSHAPRVTQLSHVPIEGDQAAAIAHGRDVVPAGTCGLVAPPRARFRAACGTRRLCGRAPCRWSFSRPRRLRLADRAWT